MLAVVKVEELLTPDEREAVERILSTSVASGVQLKAAEQIRTDDDRVVRLSSADDSWIVKRTRHSSEERLYGGWGFFAEWVGAETVTATGLDVSPAFVGGDTTTTLMVFEDVGQGRDVSEVMRADDPDTATDALVSMGASLGRMHAATALPEVEEDYRRRWHELCGDRPSPRVRLPRTTLAESVNQALAEAGIEFAFESADLDELHRWVFDGRDGWALIHGDPCLDNWILDVDGTPKLIDFQGATYAPAALDAAYARAPFPTCWCLRRVPDAVVAAFEEAHRGALAAAGHELGDPVAHGRHLSFATAWWFTVQLLWLRAAVEQPVEPREYLGFRLVPRRHSVLLRLDSLLTRSAETGTLSGLAEQAAELRGLLVRRWGEYEVDAYPAFGGSP